MILGLVPTMAKVAINYAPVLIVCCVSLAGLLSITVKSQAKHIESHDISEQALKTLF